MAFFIFRVDVGAVADKVRDDRVRASHGGSVERRLAFVGGCVDIRAVVETQFDGVDGVGFRAVTLAVAPADARGDHERGHLRVRCNQRIRALVEQESHHFEIVRFGRAQKGRCASPHGVVGDIERAARWNESGQPRVGIGIAGEEGFNEVKAAELVGRDGVRARRRVERVHVNRGVEGERPL